MKGELVKEQQRSAGAERARAAFLAAWRENRKRGGAARTIQRHFRARRVRRLLARTTFNAKASFADCSLLAAALHSSPSRLSQSMCVANGRIGSVFSGSDAGGRECIKRVFLCEYGKMIDLSPDLCPQALEAVEGEKWTLEGQKAEMAAQQRRHLAWSGQALVANSVSLMEEAVDAIRAAFLCTSKELKWVSSQREALHALHTWLGRRW